MKSRSEFLSVFLAAVILYGACTQRNKKPGTEELTTDSLLTLLQYRTFQYFWDGAEPVSGMACERIHMDEVYPDNDMNVVTSGGTGFGVMAILVGIERGFITRNEGFERFKKIVSFLEEADRFHGAWPHWIYGETGKVKPFSGKDNGADLVETAYLIQGLLCVREYFKDGSEPERKLASDIDKLWREVEWNWFTRGGENVIYWHWSHYSFLGLDPRDLKDRYADYWEHNINHTLINWKWCSENPKNFAGYSSVCWGLTASYSVNFYSAHAPGKNNDLGVISPTAALSSMPYTPEQSLNALRYFFSDLGEKIWGKYGFYDAFSIQHNWYPQKYLAIDQGPVVIMIENYRTGLIWDLFMSCREVQNGLSRLDFSRNRR